MQVLKGGLDALLGKEIDYTIEGAAPKKQTAESAATSYNIDAQANQEIKFAYCTQFLDHAGQTDYTARRRMSSSLIWRSIGDSIVVVADDEIVKVHVHTNDPGLAMQRATDLWLPDNDHH